MIEEGTIQLVKEQMRKNIHLHISTPDPYEDIVLTTPESIDELIERLKLAREIMKNKQDKWNAIMEKEKQNEKENQSGN